MIIEYLNKFVPANEQDINIVANQLGRQPRGMLAVAARAQKNDCFGCEEGDPLVVLTSPWVESRQINKAGRIRKSNKLHTTSTSENVEKSFEPFPTLFYLTNPKYSAVLSKLEAMGYMKELQAKITQEDSEFSEKLAKNYFLAHQKYIELRDVLSCQLGLATLKKTHSDFSAGGMPSRVKCLHALVGYELAWPRVCEIAAIALDAAKKLVKGEKEA